MSPGNPDITAAVPRIDLNRRRSLDATAVGTMVLLSAVWGFQQVAVKGVLPSMAPVFQIAVRSVVAALALGALVVIRRETWAMRSGTWKPGLLVGVLFALEFLLTAEGLRFTSASHMSIFLYTAPIFAALGLHLGFREERLSSLQWLGVAFAFSGVVLALLGRGDAELGGVSWLGDLLGIAAGAAYGATTVSIRLSRLSDAPATVTLFYQLAGAAVILLAAAVVSDQTAVRPGWALAASLVFQTVVVSLFSFLAWFAMLRVYLASRLGVLSFMTPLFGVGFGVLCLGERLDRSFIAGAALVLLGILFVGARDLPRRKASPSRQQRRGEEQ